MEALSTICKSDRKQSLRPALVTNVTPSFQAIAGTFETLDLSFRVGPELDAYVKEL